MNYKTNNTIVPVICGATASGKTALSLALSEILDIEIISADSRQVYKMLDIGTAKPTREELAKVKHHFIDFLDVDKNYNAGTFGNDAYNKINEIVLRGKIPVIVGGSGLYIKALCEGLFDDNIEINQSVREELTEELNKYGIDKLYSELEKIDAVSYKRYHEKNPRRILRALEYYRATGVPFAAAQAKFSVKRNIQAVYFSIAYDRAALYARINDRVKKMWEAGLACETEKILAAGYSKMLNSLNTVGYKETIKYLEGEYSKDLAIVEIQKNSRRYAKRQITWFKRVPNINFLESNEFISEIICLFRK